MWIVQKHLAMKIYHQIGEDILGPATSEHGTKLGAKINDLISLEDHDERLASYISHKHATYVRILFYKTFKCCLKSDYYKHVCIA